MAKTILVACGTAIATSTVVAVGIQEALSDRGIDVKVRQCKTAEVQAHIDGVDLIVTTTSLTGNYGIPIIHTLAFLTGIGKEKVINDIINALKAKP
jgi:galactitol PTS system EIIB component